MHEPSSLTTVTTSLPRDFKSNTFQRKIAFYFTQTNKMYTLLTRDVSFVTGMSVLRNVSKTHFSMMQESHLQGRSDLAAYTAGANTHIRFVSDLFPHMNEA